MGGNPLRRTDRFGLDYTCISGMNALHGHIVGVLYHQFSCFRSDDGNVYCKGFGRADDSSAFDAIFSTVDGKVLNGAENFSTETECQDNGYNQCVDSCLDKSYAELEKSTPKYSWTQKGAQQCQKSNEDIRNACIKKCYSMDGLIKSVNDHANGANSP